MAASMISSSTTLAAPARAQGLPSLGRRASSFAVVSGIGKKIKTDKPYGIGGGLTVDKDASGRKVKVRRPNLYIGTEFSRRFQGNFGDSSWCIN
jgi:hypothetical protein